MSATRPVKHDASEHKAEAPKARAARGDAPKARAARGDALAVRAAPRDTDAPEAPVTLVPYAATGHVQWDIYCIVRECFCPYRGIRIESALMTQKDLIKHMQFDSQVSVLGVARDGSRVVIAVLARDQDGNNRVATKSDALQQFLSTVRDDSAHIILISPCAYSPAVIAQIERRGMLSRVSRYAYDHFKIVVPLGPLCSPHRILTAPQATEALATYHIEREDMKRIYTYDPQIIWLGARAGDIIAIERNNPVTGRSADLRVVVAGMPRM